MSSRIRFDSWFLALVAAIALVTGAVVAQAKKPGNPPAAPATDQGVNDYLHPLPAAELPSVFIHVNVNNNDFFNMSVPIGPMDLRWHVLQREGTGPFGTPGALSPFGAILHPDGVHVWAASAQGAGFPQVHRINRFTGEVDFQTEPFDPTRPGDMPGPWVVGNYFVYDDEGNVYIMDDLHVYSWDADANLRWKTPLPAVTMPDGTVQQISRPWIGSPIITNERLIGSATADGFWLFLDMADGSVVAAQPYLPTVEVTCEAPVEALGLLVGLVVGEVAPSVSVGLTCGAFGRGLKITETTGYHPQSGLILQNNGNADGTSSRIAAFRLVDKPGGAPGEKFLETVWTNEDVPSGGATSPSISLDGELVVIADGDGKFRGFDVQTGELEWISEEEGEAALSPAMDEAGNLVASNRRGLLKFSGNEGGPVPPGGVIYFQNYDFLAPPLVPSERPFPPLVPDGTPKTNLLSVQMTGPDHFISAPTFSYNVVNQGIILPIFENLFFSNQLAGYMLTDADTGDLVPESFGPIDLNGGSFDTSLHPTVDGWVTGQVTDIFGLVFSLTTEALVPPRFKSEGPRFGVYAMETSDHATNACHRIDGIRGWNKEAGKLKDDPQGTFNLVRRGVPALKEEAIPTEVEMAAAMGVISAQDAARANVALASARAEQTEAKLLLLDGASSKTVEKTLKAADKALKNAEKELDCNKR